MGGREKHRERGEIEKQREKERGRERERERERGGREKQRERETERERKRQRETETDTWTNLHQTDDDPLNRYSQKLTQHVCRYKQTDRETDKETINTYAYAYWDTLTRPVMPAVSVLLVKLTVLPNRQYLGILFPITPVTTSPE